MAGNGPFVLPQYQGNYYDLQRQQALAAALTQNALTPQQPMQTVGSGGSQNYQVMPKVSPLQSLSQLGQAYLAAKLSQQAGQGLNNLGQAQMNWATGSGSGLGAMSNAIGNMGADGSSPLPQPPAGQPGAAAGTAGGNDAASGSSGAAHNVTAQQQGALAPGGSLNPAGWPIQMAAMRFFADPEGYWKDQAAAIAPTDQIKNNQWMHITPEQAGANYQNEATKNATITGRWGYGTPNGQGGFNPTVVPTQIPGAQLTTQNGGQTWAYNPVPGGAQALQQEAGAQASGKAQYNIVPGMQGGRPVNTTAFNIANGLPPPGQAGAPGGVNSGRFGGYQAPSSAPVAPSLAPGGEALAEGSAKSFNDLRAQASSTPTAIDGYNRAEQVLTEGVTTGPGSTFGTNIIGRLNTAGIPIMKGDATGYQSLQKYLANANAQAAAASGYNGSDARFESFSHGQPSAENMNPQSLRYAIQYVRGQQAGVQAKYQAAQSFLNANDNSTVNYPQFEAQWNRVYSPDVMTVRSMPNQADQQTYLNQLKQQGKLNDFIKSYQGMQQMGAF
ncbi:hypothetical protein [Paraburkholderia tropica]|uniref:hypothetical protein n=1 Tax=Paraburkholderia tropica TaxID=92647 RepID=UPI00158FAD18|nr:hypothetical protein [Paraburkholderia tropica]